ncbi:type II secretion system protein [Lentisphaerota bacterium WC36G]|nr:type II secretion system GspH family protein [Lentisphaerae bacterium WC36]
MLKKRDKIRVKAFTLVEILVVLAIIIVLAGLITPAINVARTKARILEANTEANSLKIAIEQFKADNNDLLPVLNSGQDTILYCGNTTQDETSPDPITIGGVDITGIGFQGSTGSTIDSESDYADFLKKLMGINMSSGVGAEVASPKNKRKKMYLSPKNGVAVDDTSSDGQVIKSFVTRWGSPYVFILDTNYDNKIELTIDGEDVTLNGSVFVLAPGINGENTSTAGIRAFKFNSNNQENYYLDKDTIKSFK